MILLNSFALSMPFLAKNFCASLWLMGVRDINHDPPNAISLLPDPHVAARLDHILRVVDHFIRPMRVTEVTGERDAAADWLPPNPALRCCQRLSRGLNADVWKVARTIKPDVTPGINGKDRSKCLLPLCTGIVSIALQQCRQRRCLVDRLERRLLVRIRRWRLSKRLWST